MIDTLILNTIETELNNIKAKRDPEHFNNKRIDEEISEILETLNELKDPDRPADPYYIEKDKRRIIYIYTTIQTIKDLMKAKINPDSINTDVLNSILEKTDSIITETADLKVRDGTYNIAYTDRQRKTIYLNHNEILQESETEKEFFILVNALNYHELAHNIYTDYDPQTIAYFLNNNSYLNPQLFKELLNCFEDTRIENLFFKLYPKLKDYFSYTAGKLILNPLIQDLKDPQKKADESDLFRYLSLYGRKFLYLNPKHKQDLGILRTKIKGRYANLKDFETLINDFNIETDINKKLEIIKKCYDLLAQQQKQRPKGNGDQDGDEQENEKQKGKGTDPSKETKDSTDKQDSDQETDGDGIGTDQNGTDTNTDLKDLTNINPNGKNIFKDSENLKRPKETKKEQKDREEREKQAIEKLKKDIEKLNKEQEQTENDPETDQDLNNSLKDIDTLSEDIKSEIEKDLSRIIQMKNDELGFSISAEHNAERKRIEDIIKTLRADLNFRIIRNQKRGKFDIKSYIKTQVRHSDPTQIYKNVIKNKVDKSKMLISLCIDKSGSMSGDKIKNAIETTYIFSQALENLKNEVEVLSFSSRNEIVKPFKQKGNFKIYANGDTFLSRTLEQAHEDLNEMEKTEQVKNKFCFVISDGGFSDRGETQYNLRKMRDSNIKTIWILINDSNGRRKKNKNNSTQIKNYCGFDYFIEIDNFKDLGTELKNLIKDFQTDINSNLLK